MSVIRCQNPAISWYLESGIGKCRSFLVRNLLYPGTWSKELENVGHSLSETCYLLALGVRNEKKKSVIYCQKHTISWHWDKGIVKCQSFLVKNLPSPGIGSKAMLNVSHSLYDTCCLLALGVMAFTNVRHSLAESYFLAQGVRHWKMSAILCQDPVISWHKE